MNHRQSDHQSAFVMAMLCCLQFQCGRGRLGEIRIDDRSDLASPSLLTSLTGDGQIELRWLAANQEHRFKGYQVFAAKDESVAALQELVKFPKGVHLEQGASIPYCRDNAAFFHKFGIASSRLPCSRGEKFETNDPLGYPFSSHLNCYDQLGQLLGDSLLSLPAAEGKAKGMQRCVVKHDRSGNPLVNGIGYVFLVVAAKGDLSADVSWTSNLLEDTPAKQVLAETVSLSSRSYRAFTFDIAESKVEKSTEASCAVGTIGADVCTYGKTNPFAGGSVSSLAQRIYLGRDLDPQYGQRIFLSTSAGVEQQSRGPLMPDPLSNGTLMTTGPGDAAGEIYQATGTQFVVLGNQIFDIKREEVYGKMVVRSVRYDDPSDSTSTAKIDLTIIMQPKRGTRHY